MRNLLLAISLSAVVLSTAGPALADTDPHVGDRATIGDAGRGNGLMCAPTQQGADDLIQAILAHDRDGVEAIMVPNGVWLSKGDRVLVIGQGGFLGENIKLRVLTGQFAHKTCYTQSDFPNLFQ